MKVSDRPLSRQKLGPMTLAELQSTDPEYERIPSICRRFGVSRAFVFRALHLGVKSIHLKRPGATKGIRLVSVSAMRNFLESFIEA
jgi:hypothetical protein